MGFDTAKSAKLDGANESHKTGQSGSRYEQPQAMQSPFPPPTVGVKESGPYVKLFGGMYGPDYGMDSPKKIESSATEYSDKAPDSDPDCPVAPYYSVEHGVIGKDSKTVTINYKFGKGVKSIKSSWINKEMTGAVINFSERVIGHQIDWDQKNQPKFIENSSARGTSEITQTSQEGIYAFSEVLALPSNKNLPSLISSFTTCVDSEAHLVVTRLEEGDQRDVENHSDSDKEDPNIRQTHVRKPVPFLKGDKDEFDIDPNDITQRETGDCYIMAILMSLANTENGREIIRSMIKEQPTYQGKEQKNAFGVSFPAYEHTEVSVTNNYPYYYPPPKPTGMVYQATPDPYKEGFQNAQPGDEDREVWPMLIEKALAILAGHDFNQISEGDPREIFYLFTKNSHMKNIIKDHEDPDTKQIKNGLDEIKMTEIDNNEKNITYRVDDCVIGETDEETKFKPADKLQDEVGYYLIDRVPICANHDYSLLRVHYDKATKKKTYDFRNPHGKYHLDNITEAQIKRYFPTLNSGSITLPVKDTKFSPESATK